VQTSSIKETVAKRFGLEQAPTLLAQQAAIAPIAFTRLQNDGARRPRRTVAAPPDEAFSFLVTLAPLSRAEFWINGKYGRLSAVPPGATFCEDLSVDLLVDLHPPYDFLRFYLPMATLDELAHDQGLRRNGLLRTTSVGIQDPVMQGLARSVLPVLQEPGTGTALFLDSIALAFHAHVMHAYGGVLGGGSSIRAGLAPWQLRRAYAFVEAHLDADPSISDLARECRLSASHFARAFRQSAGMTPHHWLMSRRIERAKKFLLEGDLELAQIALACGFVDQSHLTRNFTRHEGYSPGKWRWLRGN
jgi:AraC family transcriptional regulator